MIAPSSTHSILYYGNITCDICPLFEECNWDIKGGLGILTCNTKEWIVIDVLYVFLEESFFTALYFRMSYCPPPSELVLHSHKCLMFLSALGNIRHLHKWDTISEDAEIICHVGCVTPCFSTFFQFGENTRWFTDGFALGRMCARCVDICHFCTKAPWV